MLRGKSEATHHGAIVRVLTVAGLTMHESLYAPNFALPNHVHDRACIGFFHQGECEESLGKRVMRLTQHSLFFRPAGEVHADRYGRTGAGCLITQVPDTWLQHVREYSPFPHEPVCVPTQDAARLGLRLLHELRSPDSSTPLVIEGLLLELAACISRRPTALPPTNKPPLWLARVMDALHAHFTDTLSLQTLAGMAGVHPVHLAREFRKHYGCSVGQYVRRLRVHHASGQLTDSNLPLAVIALEAGFASQSHFSRVFKLATGTSPARYRAVRCRR